MLLNNWEGGNSVSTCRVFKINWQTV